MNPVLLREEKEYFQRQYVLYHIEELGKIMTAYLQHVRTYVPLCIIFALTTCPFSWRALLWHMVGDCEEDFTDSSHYSALSLPSTPPCDSAWTLQEEGPLPIPGDRPGSQAVLGGGRKPFLALGIRLMP